MLISCFFIAGTLFISDGRIATPIGPYSIVEDRGGHITISVGDKWRSYELRSENASVDVDTVMKLCEEQAIEKAMEKGPVWE